MHVVFALHSQLQPEEQTDLAFSLLDELEHAVCLLQHSLQSAEMLHHAARCHFASLNSTFTDWEVRWLRWGSVIKVNSGVYYRGVS
jgi:hypothetical protein